MSPLQRFAQQRPLLSFIVLAYALTWPVWFCVPLIAGQNWTMGKIITGIGFGPALAVLILDRLRGSGAPIGDRAWWRRFSVVAAVVTGLDISSLLTGDGISAADFALSTPIGLTAGGLLGCLLAGLVAGFVFAGVAGSRDPRLGSLVDLRRPPRWWAVALLLPASWMLLGVTITLAQGGQLEAVDGGLPAWQWALFLLRSMLFTLLVVAVGEEAGWRGWMLPELQQRFSPLLSSVLLGIVWGLWHLPLFLNGQYDAEPVMVLAKAGACVFLAILFTWLYNHSRGSLLLAVVLHTALNNTVRLIPPTEAMGIGMLGIILTVIIYGRMWRRQPA